MLILSRQAVEGPQRAVQSYEPSLGVPDAMTFHVAPPSADISMSTSFVGRAVELQAMVLYCNRSTPPLPGEPADMTLSVSSSLSAGATSGTLSFQNIMCGTGRTWHTYVVVDSAQSIAESDETDNVDGPTIITWHGPDHHDPELRDPCAARYVHYPDGSRLKRVHVRPGPRAPGLWVVVPGPRVLSYVGREARIRPRVMGHAGNEQR